MFSAKNREQSPQGLILDPEAFTSEEVKKKNRHSNSISTQKTA